MNPSDSEANMAKEALMEDLVKRSAGSGGGGGDAAAAGNGAAASADSVWHEVANTGGLEICKFPN